MTQVLDVVAGVLVVVGALFALTAGLGMLRFGDLWLRMHAGTKPQVLGLVLVLLGVALESLPDLGTVAALVLVAAFQAFTAPVSAHVLARAAHRSRDVPHDHFVHDDLAGFARRGREGSGDAGTPDGPGGDGGTGGRGDGSAS